ncbi:uncharacterized protein FIBRA_01520 [Fibroporia radiculosa]|uniref:FAD dependent oxidoreductase domain-containing protein n=1 Tax=Fibroporia radiculosa TaxID=599839 RepID=J4HTG7_9APHY|nr:uncharacterized protein FIBRA_01520 [Fibroporia radiculosa]CCL99502.1 predicted protein [Fibroporia radiculosa]
MSALPVPLNVYADHQATLQLHTDYGPAPLPVPNSTRSFWIDTPGANPLASEGSEGSLTADADVCIIGSGITGVSAAYHMGKLLKGPETSVQPLKVVILEARDFCSGATGRNGGHLTPIAFRDFRPAATAHGTDEALRWLALERHTATEIVKIIQEHELEQTVDLVEGGHIDLMFTPEEVADMKADYEAAKEAGVDLNNVRWFDEAEMKAQHGTAYPGVRAPGHNLWPLKFVTELYKLAASSPQLSLALHTRTPVTAVSLAEGTEDSSLSRRWTVTTPRGSLACSYVLHATNAYASHLLPHLRGPAGIIPTRGQIIATRANTTTEVLSRSSFSGNEGFEYWFPRPIKESDVSGYPLVILGGGREAATPAYELYVADDSAVSADVSDVLRKFLPAVFPGKYEEGHEPEMEWTGIMGFTASGDPFVGPVAGTSKEDIAESFKGQYISAGYTGHGMPRAFACAEAVSQMIAADFMGRDWVIPEWLPRHYVTDL